MEQATQSWSFVIMCYNEQGNVLSVIKNIEYLVKTTGISDYEIIIVDDHSTDNSWDIIKNLQQSNNHISGIRHEQNLGIGNVLYTGYKKAKNENVVAVPGDGQFDIKELEAFVNIPSKTIISFYRVENTTYSLRRNILSWFNKAVNIITLGLNLKDVNWVKVYKNKELKKIPIKLRSSLIESEICSKLKINNNKIREIRSKYLPRNEGKSKGSSLKIIMLALKDIFKLILIVNLYRLKQIGNSNSR